MPAKKKVLILCTHNSSRSQMAEGLLRHYGGEHFEVASAGTVATRVREEAIEVMREIGINISHHTSKTLYDLPLQSFDVVMTVCDSAKEQCPYFPGKILIHWSFDDPAAVYGDWDERLAAFRRVRDEILVKLKYFITVYTREN